MRYKKITVGTAYDGFKCSLYGAGHVLAPISIGTNQNAVVQCVALQCGSNYQEKQFYWLNEWIAIDFTFDYLFKRRKKRSTQRNKRKKSKNEEKKWLRSQRICSL